MIGSLTFLKQKSINVFMKNTMLQEDEEFSIFSTKKFNECYVLGSKIGEVYIHFTHKVKIFIGWVSSCEKSN